jgi:hypothetical protein
MDIIGNEPRMRDATAIQVKNAFSPEHRLPTPAQSGAHKVTKYSIKWLRCGFATSTSTTIIPNHRTRSQCEESVAFQAIITGNPDFTGSNCQS